MKKRFGLFLCITLGLCLMLTACGKEKTIYGRVVERTVENGKITALVVQEEDGEKTGLILHPEGSIISWLEGVEPEILLEDPLPAVKVVGWRDGGRATRMEAGGERIPAYVTRSIHVEEVAEEDAVILLDGTAIDVWRQSASRSYLEKDGQEILWETPPLWPEHVQVMGTEGLSDVEEAAREKIVAFYRERGLLYDLNAELEKAHADYKAHQPGEEDFQARVVGQEISPTAGAPGVVYFLTQLNMPQAGTAYGTSLRLGEAFDRQTGQKLEMEDLFTCSPEEVLEKILEMAALGDPALAQEMRAAFDQANMVFFNENMEVSFPAGSLPSQEYMYIVGLEYEKGLAEIMHPWAVPVQPQR